MNLKNKLTYLLKVAGWLVCTDGPSSVLTAAACKIVPVLQRFTLNIYLVYKI